jgi:hypothetical protein
MAHGGGLLSVFALPFRTIYSLFFKVSGWVPAGPTRRLGFMRRLALHTSGLHLPL